MKIQIKGGVVIFAMVQGKKCTIWNGRSTFKIDFAIYNRPKIWGQINNLEPKIGMS